MKIQNNVNAFKRTQPEKLPKAEEKELEAKWIPDGRKVNFESLKDGVYQYSYPSKKSAEAAKEALEKCTTYVKKVTGPTQIANAWILTVTIQTVPTQPKDTTNNGNASQLSLNDKTAAAIKQGNSKLNDFIKANENKAVLSKLDTADQIDKKATAKNSILSQAAQSMLAQANQQNKGVLRYLD